MSAEIPKFKTGDEVQIMQTDGMVNLGVACITGIISKPLINDVYVVMCDDNKLRAINACVLVGNHHGHIIKKGITIADISYKISPYSGDLNRARYHCKDLT